MTDTTATILEIPDDAPPSTGPDRPSRWSAYYELIKPRMNLLVLGTTAVGFDMAARRMGDWIRWPGTMLGTALCAAGAAILNQFVERRHDSLMPRTARRPLPTGQVTPTTAILLGLAASILGVAALWLLVNTVTALLGAATLLIYVLIYTPLKRITPLNTVVGAIPGAIPPLMGWAAVAGNLSRPGMALGAILFVWQIPHFLAIATLYRDDYRAGGFKMLPVDDPNLSATSRYILLWSGALVPISLAPTVAGIAGSLYAVGAIILGLGFLYFAVLAAMQRNRPAARRLFLFSIIYLPALLTLMMIDKR